ncbi:MAG: ArsC/Spx/MgsR family protein, partial [Candidatus Binatia bacterium]
MDILRERGVEFDAIEYLKQPIDRAGLARILGLLDTPPASLVRRDKRFAELGLELDERATAEQVIDVLVRHPELMQRPVVIRGERAVIARPA